MGNGEVEESLITKRGVKNRQRFTGTRAEGTVSRKAFIE